MNGRAALLGLVNTRFADPCGHDREGQYTSAADLARLAEEVMRHDEYLRLARLERVSSKHAGRRPQLRAAQHQRAARALSRRASA